MYMVRKSSPSSCWSPFFCPYSNHTTLLMMDGSMVSKKKWLHSPVTVIIEGAWNTLCDKLNRYSRHRRCPGGRSNAAIMTSSIAAFSSLHISCVSTRSAIATSSLVSPLPVALVLKGARSEEQAGGLCGRHLLDNSVSTGGAAPSKSAQSSMKPSPYSANVMPTNLATLCFSSNACSESTFPYRLSSSLSSALSPQASSKNCSSSLSGASHPVAPSLAVAYTQSPSLQASSSPLAPRKYSSVTVSAPPTLRLDGRTAELVVRDAALSGLLQSLPDALLRHELTYCSPSL